MTRDAAKTAPRPYPSLNEPFSLSDRRHVANQTKPVLAPGQIFTDWASI